jgi:ribosomal protein S27E
MSSNNSGWTFGPASSQIQKIQEKTFEDTDPFMQSIKKHDRTVIPEFSWMPQYMIREPLYSWEELMLIARTSWVLKRTFSAVIRETLSPGWAIEPAFAGKCTRCGKEYRDWPKEGRCTEEHVDENNPEATGVVCGGPLRRPSRQQYENAIRIVTMPAEGITFYQLLYSTLAYDLAISNYFLSISYKYVPDPMSPYDYIKIPYELNIEDPRFMRAITDDKGHLGDPKQLFCPDCWIPDLVYSAPQYTNCPICGKPLEKTAYIQRIGGTIKARFTKDEIILAGSDRILPYIYSESKIISLYKLLISIQSMDDFNLDLYTEGKLGSIINFPGQSQEEVNEAMQQFEDEVSKRRVYDPVLRRFRTSKKVRSIMLASEQPIRVTKVMEDFKKMQSIEYYKHWQMAVQSVYSVMPIFTGQVDGKSGTTPMMQVTVQDRAIREHHRNREDLMNNRVFPAFKISDWRFRFNTLALKDDVQHAQIGQIKANTALTWLKAGFSVRLNDHGQLEVSGQGVNPQPANPNRGFSPPGTENVPLLSAATGELNQRTGRFAPKPAGDQAEGFSKNVTIGNERVQEFLKVCKWINPLGDNNVEDLSRRA